MHRVDTRNELHNEGLNHARVSFQLENVELVFEVKVILIFLTHISKGHGGKK
jgi:hypothetical protein